MRTLLFLYVPVLAFSQIGFVDLRQHLKLTDAQFAQLQRNSLEHQQSQIPAATRLNTVNQEIAIETQKPSPNPLELGLRYQEIETICREQDAPRLAVHLRQLQVLNDEQRALLPALSEAQRLSAVASMASGLFLLPPVLTIARVPVGFNAPIVPTIFVGSGIPVELALYLNLTTGQADRMQSSLLAHQRFVSARNGRSAEISAELETEFRRDLPAPSQLGDRYVEMESIRRQIEERETALRSELREILTSQQRTLLEALERSQRLAQAVFSARQFELLPPEPRTGPASLPDYLASIRGLLFFSGAGSLPGRSIFRTCDPAFPNVFNFVGFGGSAQSVSQ
jgi:hypothetical protein